MIKSIKNILAAFFLNKSGNVTVELALVMTVLSVLMVSGYDISRMASEKHKLEQVALTAAQYGSLATGNSADTSAITSVAQVAAGDDADLITVATSTFCLCPGGGSADCSTPCADDTDPQEYLSVIITKNFIYLFSVPALYGAVTLEGRASMPVS